jgi:hypothetical protein
MGRPSQVSVMEAVECVTIAGYERLGPLLGREQDRIMKDVAFHS